MNHHQPAPLQIYATFARVLLSLVAASVMTLASLAFAVASTRPGHSFVGYTGVLFFGVAWIWLVIRTIWRKPMLIIDSDGIVDRSAAISPGLIRWSEIDDIKVIHFMGKPMIAIFPVSAEAILARQPIFRRWVQSINAKMVGTPITIPSQLLPMKVEELLQLIEAHRREHVSR